MDDRESSTGTELENAEPVMTAYAANPWHQLFSPTYRRQTILALGLNVAQQLAGINAVFFYSSSMFKDAGVDDGRIGSLVTNLFNLLPTLFAGTLGARYGNRRMINLGQGLMLVCAAGYTAALLTDSPQLAVVFTAAYVAVYSVSLGPLIFIIAAAVFPDALRASGMSLCLFVNWIGVLAIGAAYPTVANSLGDFGFAPFFVTLSVSLVLTVKYLPETAGKTNDEIQAYFRSAKASEGEENSHDGDDSDNAETTSGLVPSDSSVSDIECDTFPRRTTPLGRA